MLMRLGASLAAGGDALMFFRCSIPCFKMHTTKRRLFLLHMAPIQEKKSEFGSECM